MPVIFTSEYRPSFFFRNPDINTIYLTLFRKFKGFRYIRERIYTQDGDFIDLDHSPTGSRSAAILCHGLEGNSTRHYMIGMAKALNSKNIDVTCFNFRGCSGQANQLPFAYHSGFTQDLHEVVNHVQKNYSRIYLVGFSLGGNLILKYLGENKTAISKKIKKAIVFSVPCDLDSSARKMLKLRNHVYSIRFLKMLIGKVTDKIKSHPELKNFNNCKKIKSIIDFDECYTARMHGFKNAKDYYRKSSSIYFIKNIKTPTSIISAIDDPFLTDECFPISEAARNKNVTLTLSEYGGHMGFVMNRGDETWLEKTAARILTEESEDKTLRSLK